MIKRGWRVLSAVLIAVLLGVLLFTAARHSVYGYTSQTVRKDTAYKDGYFYVVLQDMGGQMTRCRINMSRSASVKYDDFKSRGQSYSCSLVVETGNHHNVRLDSTAFTTTASNANGRYTIGNVTLRYTQHANYSFSTWASERPSGGRFGPYWQRADGSDGDLSVRTDTVYQDTETTVNVSFYVGNAGLITNSKTRYQGTALTISYAKPVYAVNFHDAAGNVYHTQNVACGDASTAPAAPSKAGHNFTGWDKSLTKITGNTEVYPKWTPWQHTLHYVADKASSVPADQIKIYGSPLTLSTQKPSRSGCSFRYWTDLDGKTYAAGASYGRDQNGGTVNLQANWSACLDLNGRLGSTDMDSLGACGTVDIYIDGKRVAENAADHYASYPLGKTYEIRNIRPKAGYAYGGVVQGSLSGSIEGFTGIRLLFTRTDYMIRYEANGGAGSMEDQKAIYDSECVLKTNQFIRNGYRFLGWSTDPDARKAQYSEGQKVTQLAKPQQTVLLYAVWQKREASFDTETLIHDEKMFVGDGELTGSYGTGYDSSHTDSSYARVDGQKQYGYFTDSR